MTNPGLAARGPRWRRSSARPWSGWQKGVAVLVPVVLAGAIIGIIVLVTASSGPAVIGPSATPPPVSQAPVTKGQKWVGGRAATLLAAVDADLGRVSAAVRAHHGSAAKAAGAKLAADAKAALAGPMPPRQAAAYRVGLKDLRQAGTEIAAGESGKASRLLAAGTVLITKVTAAVNLPAPVNPPAQVNDPNG